MLHAQTRGMPERWPEGEQPLLSDGLTFGHVYAAAAEIRSQVAATPGRVLCLASDDRFHVFAAVIAATTGEIDLVLPHSLDSAVVEAACTDQGCTSLLGDVEGVPGVTRIHLTEPLSPIGAPASAPAPQLSRISLYTGGSTGAPRVWHRILAGLFDEAAVVGGRVGVRAGDRLLATVSPLHIYGLMVSVLIPLRKGAQVVRRSSYFPREVEASLAEHQCTVLVATPPHLRILSRGLQVGAGFHRASSSGSMLLASDARRFFELTGAPIVECYGATEVGIVATRCRAQGEDWWTGVDGVQWQLRNQRLWVSSPFLAEGMAVDEQGFTRTGDRISLAQPAAGAQGSVQGFVLHGRVDGVVKVAGVRVDVGGVEEQIQGLSRVRDACVISREVEGLHENVLLAAVVYDGEEAELKRRLHQVLPPAECPRRVVRVEALPTTPSGKHDRQAVTELLERLLPAEEESRG